MRRALSAFVVSVALVEGAASCTPEPEPPPLDEVHGLAACTDDALRARPGERCHTFRAITGASMGGGAAARIGLGTPSLFDVVGVLGTPFADHAFLWRMFEENHLGGFCELADLEALLAEDPALLDDPGDPRSFCGVHDEAPESYDESYQQASPGLFPAVEGSACWMFRSDYNHWYRGPGEGRGSPFERDYLIQIFHDFLAVYGNPMFAGDDAFFPPGVPSSWDVRGGDTDGDRALCDEPVVLEGVFHREHNPEGRYPLITFCDGASGESGVYDPADDEAHRWPLAYALAVDLNENGRRDYGEPVVRFDRERFLDVGADGAASADEPGYDPDAKPDPAGDDWHPLKNPLGAEGNGLFDDGEPFDDDGLDGVPATADLGEGNGAFDRSPGFERWLARSPAHHALALSDAQTSRLDVWLDAGVRDFINSAQMTNALVGKLKTRIDDARVYDGFASVPRAGLADTYQYWDVDYSRDALGQVAYLRYGDPSICPRSDDILGDGNHVGPDIIQRLFTLFSFATARMPSEGRDESLGGEIADLESPNGVLSDFAFLDRFESEVLGHEQPFGVLLPPDYFLEDRQDVRYPVIYFLHGQGNSAEQLVGLGLILWSSMKESVRADRVDAGLTDMSRAILVFPDGQCRGDECFTGTFYADFEGQPRDDRRFESALYELMRVVEQRFRVRAPAFLPAE